MMLAGAVDTLMLSTEGDQAVGAVGTANTYIGVFIIMFSIISSGVVAVMTQYIGAGELDECDRGTKQAAVIGIAIGAGCATLFALFAKPLIGLFTDDPAMIQLVGILLIVDIALEVGRVSNLVFGNALKISGDAVYPMVIAVVFAFFCAAGGTWLFGIRLGWLAVGAYIAMALDECVRAVCMFARWQSGRWRKKNLVQTKLK